MRKLFAAFFSLTLLFLAPSIASAAIIINHTTTNLGAIPDTWITQAKQTLHIAYGSASHGQQLHYGSVCLNAWDGTGKYAFNSGGTGGALDWRTWLNGNFGNLNMAMSLEMNYQSGGNRTIWADATRVYLDAHPEVNVIIWAWCYGANTSPENINLYLGLMSDLEEDYPNVKFVYMTGHTDGTGLSGNLHVRNDQIRAYCIANNKILYDFEDIESWNPDGVYFGDRNCNANCDYTGGNWAIEWQNAHPGAWFPCDQCLSCHSQPLNCNLKARAVWWLWARLAGWNGGTNQTCTDNDGDTYGVGCVAGADCNDNNVSIHPGATEVCDGVDNDCDSSIDEGVRSTYYRDLDGDTYGNLTSTQLACSLPTGYVTTSTDCNDNNASIRPGATELCNGVDDDCDGSTDEGFSLTTYYRDADNDTYGSSSVTIQACVRPSGYVNNSNDCNDGNSNIRPGATEICGNSIDEDCSGADLSCGGGGTYALPTDRSIDWDPGIPGGIPVRTNICANVKDAPYNAAGDGVADDTAAIQAALDACPQDSVVYLPEGSYMINGQLSLTSKGLVIRGDGPTKTKILQTNPNTGIIRFTAGNSAIGTDVISGFTKGSNQLVVADASNFNAGDYALIDQLTDPELVSAFGCSYCSFRPSAQEGNRTLGETFLITGKSGNTLTIDRGLYFTFNSLFEPKLRKVTDYPVRNAGIEDLYLEMTVYGGASNIRMQYCVNCWIKNVESNKCGTEHVRFVGNYKSVIRDSYFHHGYVYYGGASYGVMLYNHNTANLIENNVFYYLRHSMVIEGGGAGNVFGYCYSDRMFTDDYLDTSFLMCDMSLHGSHPYMNLFEGNMGNHMSPDFTHGSSSHNTFFRNHADMESMGENRDVVGSLITVDIQKYNRYINVIGNVLGKPGDNGTYEIENAVFLSGPQYKYIYKLGYEADGDAQPANNDPLVKQTLLRHGNFDYITNSTVWDPATSEHDLPASLYLTSKPSWFGSLAWPAIGPDVDPRVGATPAKLRFDAAVPGGPCRSGTTKSCSGDGNCTGTQTCNLGVWSPCPCGSTQVLGDINSDGSVNINDLVALVIDFGKTSGFIYARADTDNSGMVDIFDMTYVGSRLT